MNTAHLESNAQGASRALTYRHTFLIQGGFKHMQKVRPGIVLIDVTKISRELVPDLPETARVASPHLSYLKSLKAPRRQAADMIEAWDDILAMGYSHLAITGPLTDLASGRLTEVTRFRNAAPFVMFNTWIYRSMTSMAEMLPGKTDSNRKAHLKALRQRARQGFKSYVLFELKR